MCTSLPQVNVESTECLPPAGLRTGGIGRISFPRHAHQLMPHNFALLLRKGPGLDALLTMWMAALTSMQAANSQPDDQWALALTLRQLHRNGGCADGSVMHCRQNATVWRLYEAVAAGFKSATKACLGFFPRYTRVLDRPVLVTHHLTPYPWLAHGGGAAHARNACALLNRRPHVPRLAMLTAKGTDYQVVHYLSLIHI